MPSSLVIASLEEAYSLAGSFARAMLAGGETETCDAVSLTSKQIARACRVPRVSDGTDLIVLVVFTCVFFAINWGVRLALVEPIARVLLGAPPQGTDRASLKAQRQKAMKVTKFAQAGMELLFYGAFSVFGYITLRAQPWAWPSALWWKDHATTIRSPFQHSLGEEIPATTYMSHALASFYIMYAARYLQGLISVFLEHRRKDFLQMLAHHVFTVVVVSCSYACGYNRVGIVVMLLFDPSDVGLHAAKMSKYIFESSGMAVMDLLANVFFAFFMLSFFAFRLALFPYVCWSAHIEREYYIEQTTGAHVCVGLLYALLALNLFWGYLIVKVLWGLITSGAVEDNRSDDEDEDEKLKDA
eukprot:TRINITY_DN46925_c0_g1_i1.p1 TRINITY_DN46925_c0_g1~~TRINITY_DN46925_c0_g1_i1.p1  ORF type:complete len:357 (-),score=76.55 TRINITY_DN46925_c0_g1_i1:198-1268(-)